MRDAVPPHTDALLPEATDPTPADLARVADRLAAREDLWAPLAARLGPDEPTRVAGGRGWEAWLHAGAGDDADVVRLEVLARRPRAGRRARAEAAWRRTADGLSPLRTEGIAS